MDGFQRSECEGKDRYRFTKKEEERVGCNGNDEDVVILERLYKEIKIKIKSNKIKGKELHFFDLFLFSYKYMYRIGRGK
jgi:hypothetical protein